MRGDKTDFEIKITERFKTLRLHFYKVLCTCLSGSQVTCIPSDLKVRSSAYASITVECTSQFFSLSSCAIACFAFGSLTAQMASAINTSSVCNRGLIDPMCWTFKRCTGSITVGEINSTLSSISPNAFRRSTGKPRSRQAGRWSFPSRYARR